MPKLPNPLPMSADASAALHRAFGNSPTQNIEDPAELAQILGIAPHDIDHMDSNLAVLGHSKDAKTLWWVLAVSFVTQRGKTFADPDDLWETVMAGMKDFADKLGQATNLPAGQAH